MNKGLEALEKIKEHLRELHKEIDNDDYIHLFEMLPFITIEKELKEYQQHEEILNDYGLTLVNFREACLLLAMLKGEGRNIHNIDKQLKALEIIRKYVKEQVANIDNGHEQKCLLMLVMEKEKDYDLLKEVLL